MIIFIEGALGSGKSMECTSRILEELIYTDRFITTNMPLRLEAMQKLLLEKYKDDFRMFERIRILKDKECFKFWLHPALNYEIDKTVEVSPDDGEGNKPVIRPDYSDLKPEKGWPGALILIDECPEYFDAEGWASVHGNCKYFLRHSRKITTDCVFVAQDRGQIAKPLRVFAQKTIVMRNLGYERIGLFRAPDKLYWREYFKTPDVSPKPQASGLRAIDAKWLGQMYDTSAGVGMGGGRRADVGRRKKGLPAWTLVLCVVGICVALWSVPKAIAFAIGRVSPKAPKAAAVVPSVTNSGALPPVAAPRPVRAPGRRTTHVVNGCTESDDSEDGVSMCGYVCLNNVWRVVLSDGRIVRSDDPEFETLTERGLKYAGHYYRRALVQRVDAGGALASSVATEVAPRAGKVVPLDAHTYTPPAPDPSIEARTYVNVHWQDGTVTHHVATVAAPEAVSPK